MAEPNIAALGIAGSHVISGAGHLQQSIDELRTQVRSLTTALGANTQAVRAPGASAAGSGSLRGMMAAMAASRGVATAPGMAALGAAALGAHVAGNSSAALPPTLTPSMVSSAVRATQAQAAPASGAHTAGNSTAAPAAGVGMLGVRGQQIGGSWAPLPSGVGMLGVRGQQIGGSWTAGNSSQTGGGGGGGAPPPGAATPAGSSSQPSGGGGGPRQRQTPQQQQQARLRDAIINPAAATRRAWRNNAPLPLLAATTIAGSTANFLGEYAQSMNDPASALDRFANRAGMAQSGSYSTAYSRARYLVNDVSGLNMADKAAGAGALMDRVGFNPVGADGRTNPMFAREMGSMRSLAFLNPGQGDAQAANTLAMLQSPKGYWAARQLGMPGTWSKGTPLTMSQMSDNLLKRDFRGRDITKLTPEQIAAESSESGTLYRLANDFATGAGGGAAERDQMLRFIQGRQKAFSKGMTSSEFDSLTTAAAGKGKAGEKARKRLSDMDIGLGDTIQQLQQTRDSVKDERTADQLITFKDGLKVATTAVEAFGGMLNNILHGSGAGAAGSFGAGLTGGLSNLGMGAGASLLGHVGGAMLLRRMGGAAGRGVGGSLGLGALGGRLGGGLARGAGSLLKGGAAALALGGVDYGIDNWVVPHVGKDHSTTRRTARAAATVGEDAASGALAGSMFGPWGTAIGGLIGGGVGAWNAYHHWDEDKDEGEDSDPLIGQAGGGGIRAPKKAGQGQQGGESDPRAAKAVAAATGVLGLPYKWGGTNPQKGLDCSGLTQYAYQQAGITLPRTTYEQIKVGHAVSGGYQAGDLLFPHAGHVLMAISPTEAIEEPHTGAVARRVPIPKNLLAARRVFNPGGGDAAGTPQAEGAPAGGGTAATGSQDSKTGASGAAGAAGAAGLLDKILSGMAGMKEGSGGVIGAETDVMRTAMTAPGAAGMGVASLLGAGAPASAGGGTGAGADTGGAPSDAPQAAPTAGSGKATGSLDGMIRDAMKRTNTDAKFFDILKQRIMIESSGSPTAVNKTDSNAKAGHPSRGLMQLIPSNFAQYRDPGLPNDINDPEANIVAGIHYINSRYKDKGTWNEIARRNNKKIGYASGSWNIPKDQYAMIHQGEMVIPRIQAEALRQVMVAGREHAGHQTSQAGARGANVTINCNVNVGGAGLMSEGGARTIGKRIVDTIAADERLRKLGAGL